ncbi:MAG: TetR/AcrR family transcriptional regulator [Marinobacter sp.]|nr:TetR/AcrR family transcriptional regulator [Marinobacter sp.]
MSKPSPIPAAKPAAKRLPRLERERQMLEAAAVAFGRNGFEATSMDEIAAACGVTKPMLYNYFKSKEGLYAAMIERAGSYLVGAIINVGKEPDPVRRLHLAMGVFLDFVERYRDSWRMVFSARGAQGSQQSNIASYRQQVMQAAVYTLASLRPAVLDKAQARALVEPYAYGLLGAGEAIAQWWLSHPAVAKAQAQHAIAGMIDGTVATVQAEFRAA